MYDILHQIIENIKKTQRLYKTSAGVDKQKYCLSALRLYFVDDSDALKIINEQGEALIDFVFSAIRDKDLQKLLKRSCHICF